ncbi:MAG: hypothetical protein HKN32_04475 [Flavobacteriales bacterium]|nr:hypothetical protein [Flavobacteriales bacterium]
MKYFILFVAFTSTFFAAAQGRADDVKDVDSIVDAVYEIISGEPGERDWDRFRHLFAEGATLNSVRSGGGISRYRHGSVEEYINGTAPILMKESFQEREIGRNTEVLDNLVHLWSGFECELGTLKQYGVNSIQLIFHEGRWWIAHLTFNVQPKEEVMRYFGL